MNRYLLSALVLGLVAACGTVPQDQKGGAVSDQSIAKAVKPADEKLSGPAEDLTCFTGIQDRHARMGVRLVGEKIDYFAFYSKRKPRTCSIDVGRDGHNGSWEENRKYTKITLRDDGGILLIHRTGASYRFDFRNVDRMKYCGMDGKINGSLTVKRGESKCIVSGLMDGH